MTNLQALNKILIDKLAGERKGGSILDTLNLIVKEYGGEGSAKSTAEALAQLETYFERAEGGNASIDWERLSSVKSPYLQKCLCWINTKGLVFTSQTARKMDTLFDGCSGLETVDLGGIEGSEFVTSLYRTFAETGIREIDFTPISTENVTAARFTFFGCFNLKSIKDVKGLNTSKITSLQSCFSNCRNLTEVDFDWNLPAVTSMSLVFKGCTALKTVDFSKSNMPLIESFDDAFEQCSSLESVDFTGLNTEHASSFNMFSGAASFHRLTNVTWASNWLSSPSCSNFSLGLCTALSKESLMDLINKLAVRENAPVLTLAKASYNLLSEDEIKIATDKGWTVAK